MLAVFAIAAHAYETDQLTWRVRQLADATPQANRVMNQMIGAAVRQVNDRTSCIGTDEQLRTELAREIHGATSRDTRVWSRGLLRSPGFGAYAAALEASDAVDRFAFREREDFYGAVRVRESFILAIVGPCSTFEIGGVRMGSDKMDHFLDTGFSYFREAERLDVEQAVARGTLTERTFYGLFTSKTFSYADLRANWDGYRFYTSLLAPGSEVRRADDGCLVVDRPFDWRRWVDEEWDEVLNPPVYTRLVEEAVLRGLDAHRTEICTAREQWDPAGWRERALQSAAPSPYVIGPAPARRDPWQLAALCDPARQEPLVVSATRPRVEVRDQRRDLRVPTQPPRTVR